MAVLEDGMGSPMTLGDISEALSEEEVDDDDDDVFEEEVDEDDEDDDAFLERMQRERAARLNTSSSRRPESAVRGRPESARRLASSSGAAMSTGRGGDTSGGDLDFVRTPARPGTAEAPLSTTGRSIVGDGFDGSVGRSNDSRTTRDSANARPVSAARRGQRGGGAGFASARGRLTNHHNEFQPYDPYDPLDGDPVASSSGGGGCGGKDAYGAPGRMHNSRRTTASPAEKETDKASTVSPLSNLMYGSGKLSRSPYAQSLGGSLRARGDKRDGLVAPGEDDIMGSTVGSNAGSFLFHSTGAQRRNGCLLYTSPSPRDATLSRMPSSA